MTHYDFDMGILGAGAAGLTIAAGAARAGAKVLLVEKTDRLGGDCLYYGCVPSKTLIRTARVYHLMREAQKFGLPDVREAKPDYSAIARRIQSVIAAIRQHDSPERFCSLGVRVEHGSCAFLDDHSIRLNGKSLSARHWAIATGSRAAIPPIPGLAQTDFVTNKEIYSLDHLPLSMVIIGGGPLGVEFAQAFSRLGTRVAILESSSQILGNDDRDMADAVMASLRNEGVELFLGSVVTSTRNDGIEKEVAFTQEGESKAVRGEVLLVAAGRTANLDGIGLEAAGVERDRRGLKLDERLRTTRKHIFGAGDVTGTYQFTHAAGYEGGIVLINAIFHIPKKARYAYMPHVTYTDPELASIGMNEKSARALGVDYRVWTEEFSNNDRALAEGRSSGKIKLLLDEKGRPLGIQILGPNAGDLLGEWVTQLNGKVKLSTLASAVHPYPTLCEINKRVAGNFLATKVFSENVREMLTFFFGLKGRACGP